MEKLKMNSDSSFSEAGIVAQVVITMAVIMFILLYLISNIEAFGIIVGLLVGVLMLVMAVNNHMTFKRKYFTFIYFIVGIFCFILSMMKYFA